MPTRKTARAHGKPAKSPSRVAFLDRYAMHALYVRILFGGNHGVLEAATWVEQCATGSAAAKLINGQESHQSGRLYVISNPFVC